MVLLSLSQSLLLVSRLSQSLLLVSRLSQSLLLVSGLSQSMLLVSGLSQSLILVSRLSQSLLLVSGLSQSLLLVSGLSYCLINLFLTFLLIVRCFVLAPPASNFIASNMNSTFDMVRMVACPSPTCTAMLVGVVLSVLPC